MIRRLFIHNFRNISDLELQFSEPLTIFHGQNGQGKTNILEAISIVSCGSSFREPKKALWLPFTLAKVDFVELRAETDTDIQKVIVAAASGQSKPQIKYWRDDVVLPLHQFVGTLPVVAFRPEDMNLFILEPQLRRSFLDSALIQTSFAYRDAFVQAKKILTQRNALLKHAYANPSLLDEQLRFWNEQYLQHSNHIQEERCQLIDFINARLAETYQRFSSQNLPLQLAYQKSVFDPSKYAEIEKHRGFTMSGQHRDDFTVVDSIHTEPWISTCSRGEMRTIILALKSIVVDFLIEQTHATPILLLDDLLSEFDDDRQQLVLSWTARCQLFLTVAGSMPPRKHAQVFTVTKGNVLKN
jgi:DNA replication and repair protein RecF